MIPMLLISLMKNPIASLVNQTSGSRFPRVAPPVVLKFVISAWFPHDNDEISSFIDDDINFMVEHTIKPTI